MQKKVILFELNEVPYKVLDWYCKQHPGSNLAFLLSRSDQYTTVNADRILSPWVTWPSFHRGVFDDVHGIGFLGQNLEEVDRLCPPVWQILSEAGVSTGIFGSLQSYPVPTDLTNYAFYVPDVFAPANETYPSFLSSFQELNLVMSRKSARNVSNGVPKKLAVQLAAQIPILGISVSTAFQLAQQLIGERIDKVKLGRRRTYQSVLAFDIFMRQLTSTLPSFVTFFTNHVASNQHRFWAATFPEDFKSDEHDASWKALHKDEIDFAMQKTDDFIGRLLKFTQARPEYELWIATSMGQGPAKSIPFLETALLVTDLTKFMQRLGIPASDWEERPAMVPDYCVFISPEKAQSFRQAPKRLFIDGFPLAVHEKEGNFFHFSLGHADLHEKEQFALLDGEKVAFEELGLECMKSQDSISCSGDHIRDGMFLLYDGSNRKFKTDRERIPSTAVAAMILEKFNQPVPAYMSQKSSLVASTR